MKRSKTLRRALIPVLVAAVGLSIAPLSPAVDQKADAAVGNQSWSDEFNRAGGTAVDGSKWKTETGGSGWGNNELQYYTNSTSNAVHDGNGNLVITARKENPGNYQCHYGRCDYTSARLTTAGKFTQKYGKFEARIKVPRGQGIWPAFWMLGDDIGNVGWPNSGEIDIMENIGREPNKLYGTVHGPGYSGVGGITGSRDLGRPLADDFHNYGIEWSPNLIRWTIDGQEYHRVTPASTNGGKWAFDKPFFLILNVAVGGNWPGNPDGSTQFPQSMVIDWVRANSWTDGGGSNNPPPAANGVSLASNWHNKCIDVPNFNFNDGQRLIVWNCTNARNQKWEFVNGTLRTQNNKCMDVAGASKANGTAIQIANCSGNPAQQFVLSGAGDLVSVLANKCVDINGWNPNNDAVLVLWECTGGANQKWRRA